VSDIFYPGGGNPVLAELFQGGVEDLLGAYFLSCWLASCRS